MNKAPLFTSSAFVLMAVLAGCTPAPDTAAPGKAESTASLLDGEIPACTELLQPAAKPYRLAAFKECDGTRSADENRASVGCEISRRILSCTSSEDVPRSVLAAYQTAEFKAEKKEATGK